MKRDKTDAVIIFARALKILESIIRLGEREMARSLE
jgi:hypothetical protein